MPWGIAGAVLGALVTVLAMRFIGGAEGAGSTAQSAPTSLLRAPDISQMSPEERANRLFNRVMILAEAEKMDSVRFFLPMALGAYAQLGERDADVRYHIGLLELAGDDAAAALAQADTIQRSTPTHLFIYVLRAHAYERQRNSAQERRAYADFLRNEAAEMAKDRPEYADHSDALRSFKTAAARVTGSGL